MLIETVLAVASAAVMGTAGREAVQRVFGAFERRAPIARDITSELDARATLGERLADRVAAVGGSWAFVAGFGLFLLLWTLLNVVLLPPGARFDSYPFIFLNLLLSMLAAIQAPIIMMSQNRQAVIDRVAAQHDFEVNLKAEMEIMALHEKLDRMHEEHGAQLAALRVLLEGRVDVARTGAAGDAAV